jgi:hypothetical protein
MGDSEDRYIDERKIDTLGEVRKGGREKWLG